MQNIAREERKLNELLLNAFLNRFKCKFNKQNAMTFIKFLAIYSGLILILITQPFVSIKSQAQTDSEKGFYFSKKTYDGKKIPVYKNSKHLLPLPIMETNSEWIEMYWKCW